MNEQQRRKRKRELRRRRRRRRNAAVILTAAVLVLAVFAAGSAVRRQRRSLLAGAEGDIIVLSGAETAHAPGETAAVTPAGAEEGTASVTAPDAAAGAEGGGMPEGSTAAAAAPDNAAASPSGAEGRSDGEVMTLTEDQKYTGDLILVSRSWPYDFERNSEEIQLVRILDAQSFSYPVEKEEFMLAKRVMKSLDSMIHDCDQYLGTSDTAISSAYRSTEYQQEVFDEAADEYGSDYAEAYVAYPGYSEHHTGLAADLGIIYDDGSVGTFTDSANAEWMAANSYKYGFVRRYAEDKTEITGISNESWHFRYVGIPHSVFMYENNYCLEEYLEYLKNGTSPYEPLVIEYNGESYSVYYTSESTVPRPGHRFDVSGDNKGGYIITVHGS